jgi:hypothetical protein
MKFVDDVKGLWHDSNTLERIVVVVTFPILIVAYWLAKAFDTDDLD